MMAMLNYIFDGRHDLILFFLKSAVNLPDDLYLTLTARYQLPTLPLDQTNVAFRQWMRSFSGVHVTNHVKIKQLFTLFHCLVAKKPLKQLCQPKQTMLAEIKAPYYSTVVNPDADYFWQQTPRFDTRCIFGPNQSTCCFHILAVLFIICSEFIKVGADQRHQLLKEREGWYEQENKCDIYREKAQSFEMRSSIAQIIMYVSLTLELLFILLIMLQPTLKKNYHIRQIKRLLNQLWVDNDAFDRHNLQVV